MTATNPADPLWQAAVAAAQEIVYGGPDMGGEDIIAEALTAALGKLGARLVSPDADTRPTFGVRMTYDDGTVTEDECERSLADARVRFHAERRQTKPGWRVVKAELIERTWRASPWVPVPTPDAGPDLAPNMADSERSPSSDGGPASVPTTLETP